MTVPFRSNRSMPACSVIPVLERHRERAVNAGARVVSEPSASPYGEKQYTVQDIGGHVWTFSETVEDVDPASWGGSQG